MRKSDGINERLECGTDLSIRRRESAIELALRIIAATDERADAAAAVVDRHQRAFQIWHGGIGFTVLGHFVICLDWMIEIRLMLDFCKLRLERRLRGVLHLRVERGVNKETAVVDLILSEQQVQIALHRIHCVILLDLHDPFGMRINLCELCWFGLGAGNFL